MKCPLSDNMSSKIRYFIRLHSDNELDKRWYTW